MESRWSRDHADDIVIHSAIGLFQSSKRLKSNGNPNDISG
jgi:hypothetical protein